MNSARVIAIDGPAASGKSSTAAAVARALHFAHIDSGSLYRALAWIAVRHALDDPASILEQAAARHVGLEHRGHAFAVHIDELDQVDAALRGADVNASVSAIAAMSPLRTWVNQHVRSAAHDQTGVVIDGRDIGTVVVPDAKLKVFLTATPRARAERRLVQRGDGVDASRLDAETARLAERDRRDASRLEAPLKAAPDALMLDTTSLTFDEQVAQIVALARSRGMAR